MNKRWFIDDGTLLQNLILVDKNANKTKNGSTLLHMVCTCKCNALHTKIWLVDFLLTEGHFNPNCLDSKGQTPLQLATDSEIMKELIEHGAKMTKDVVFKVISSKHITDSSASNLFTLSTRKGTMLWKANDLNSLGDIALHLTCKHDKTAITNYLLTEAKCDPNANNIYSVPPLQITTDLQTAMLLIKHGARVTPELVLRFEDMETKQNKHSLIGLMLTTWNPDDRHRDGYTALHLACNADRPTTVNLLLSIAHWDPNIKSDYGNVPLQMTKNY